MTKAELEAIRNRNWTPGHQAREDCDALLAHIDELEANAGEWYWVSRDLGGQIAELEAENERLKEVAEKVLELADTWTPPELLELAKAALEEK